MINCRNFKIRTLINFFIPKWLFASTKEYPETVKELIKMLEKEFPFQASPSNRQGWTKAITKEYGAGIVNNNKIQKKKMITALYVKIKKTALQNNKKSVLWRIKPEIFSKFIDGKIRTTIYTRVIFI